MADVSFFYMKLVIWNVGPHGLEQYEIFEIRKSMPVDAARMVAQMTGCLCIVMEKGFQRLVVYLDLSSHGADI
jgi:hypothetical protein